MTRAYSPVGSHKLFMEITNLISEILLTISQNPMIERRAMRSLLHRDNNKKIILREDSSVSIMMRPQIC